MAEPVRRTLTIAAPPDRVLSVVTDFDDYPKWQKEIESTETVERDDQGRPVRVKMVTVAMGTKMHSEIALTYHDDGVEWHLLSGDMLVQNDTRYVLKGNGDGGTDVDLEMVLGLKLKLPEFMMKQIITKGVNDNLKAIKKVSETA